MRTTFRLATTVSALLLLTAPLAAQQTPDGSKGTSTTGGTATPAAAPVEKTDEEKAAEAAKKSWIEGRPMTIQYLRAADKRGLNVFETTKDPGVEFKGFKLDFGAAFTSQVQNLSHRNTAAPNVVNGVNANQLADIGFGFNNSTANAVLHAQLAPGIRVQLTSYLSARHHNETWVKDGYIQIDQSPINWAPAKMLFEIVTVKVGHMEINYGDSHFRRSDNGNAIYNPFVGNYILDSFTTEIGGEVYLKLKNVIAMGSVTGGRAARHGDGAGSARAVGHWQARVRPPDEPGAAPAPDRLDVQDRQEHEQHALQRRPRRLTLLLGAREHHRDRVRQLHLGGDQSWLPQPDHRVSAESVREVPRPGSVRRCWSRPRARPRPKRPSAPSGSMRSTWSTASTRTSSCSSARATTRPAATLVGITGEGWREARAARGGLVHHPGAARQGRIRQPDLLRLPGQQHQERRQVQRDDARRRRRLLTEAAMFLTDIFVTTGGRPGARRCLAWTAALVLGIGSLAGAGQATDPAPAVREERGVYVVSADFSVPGPAAVALTVLTDYENIPRFMPAVKTSTVTERGDDYAVVEQEAVATFMLFSKRIHLVLDVQEHAGTIRFNDRCGKSFERYEGTWTVSDTDGRTTIGYRLTAKPAFDVPAFLLKRLLKRDALQMIGQLQTEIASRAAAR